MLCFLDDTNNSKFETTIAFVKKAFLHDVAPCGSNKGLLPYKLTHISCYWYLSLFIFSGKVMSNYTTIEKKFQ